MESSNLHHQLQDQFLTSSTPLPNPSFYVPATSHAWTPTTTNLNGGDYFNPIRQQNDILVPSLDTSMTQDLGFHWAINKGSFTNHLPAHDLHLMRIKEELPADSFTKFTQMMNRASGSIIDDFELNPTPYMIKNSDHNNLSEKLLLRNFSSGCEINGLQPSAEDQYYSNAKIFPTVNISNLNQQPMDMNLQALDLFASSRFCTDLSPPQKHASLFKDSANSYGSTTTHENLMQQLPNHRPPSLPTKTSNGGVPESKRPSSSLLEPKEPQAATKKSRLDSRASCPPFKVRKEKLGDRIAGLQQLVAPFGKTDTASVLMEAIGYIKFLQNQVETLSVPYMKSSGNKTTRTMHGGSIEDGNEEIRRDLRSRGLCLVPVSCLSYVAEGGGVWPLPNFGPGT